MSYTIRIATLCLLASATVAQLGLGSNEQAATDCLQCPNPIGDIKALACAVDWISKLRILNKTTTTIGGQTVDAYTLEHLDILKGTLEIPSLMIGVLAGKSALFTNLCLQILQTAEPLLDKVNQGLLGEVSDLLCSVFDILPTLDTWLAGNGGLLGHLLGANGNPLLDGLIGGPSGAPGVVDAYYYPNSSSLGPNAVALVVTAHVNSQELKRLQILGWNSTGHNSYDYPFYDRMIPHNVCKWISFEIVGTTLPNMTQLAVGLGDRYEMIPYRIPSYRKHGVVTCIAPLYANEQWQYALFAAHLYRRYGSFLQLYVRSMIHPLFEMLKIYEREGYLQIDPWMRVKLKTVHEAFFNPNLHVEFRNQAAAYTDCLLQYKESAEFISFMDLDDVQIPRIGKTYFEEYSHYFFENPMTSYLHYVKEADQAARQIMMDDFTMSQMYTGIVDVLPSMEAGRFVVQPKNINFTWVHFPFSVLEDMKRYDVSSEENFVARLKPLEEYPFTSSQGIPQLFSRKGGMLRKPDFLPAEDANWLQADLKRMFKNPEIRAIWSRMPQDQFYQKLLTSCFHENYFQHYFNSKPEKMTCPGPERCNFPKNPGIECVNAHGEYYSTSGNQRMNIHYATQSHFRVEDGCTP
ncbi:unnamed protein product, partial [Mesorhabditis spiculigera]